MASLKRNHKPGVTPCQCSRCGTVNASAPADHPHRNCSGYNVKLGVLYRAASGAARGTWRRIGPEDYKAALAASAFEQTRGPTLEELADAELARELAGAEASLQATIASGLAQLSA